MRKSTLILAAVFTSLLFHSGYSQDLPYQAGLEPKPLSESELYALTRIPVLELPEAYKGPNAPLLPTWVDNSTQPYFRPITSQSGYECGQSAGVAFNFTYEIDRLRNLPANVAANQYPTHFVWDFLNNGDNYVGASFFDSWEIVRTCGTMNVVDYGGGLNTGGYTRWISGYNAYKNGMSNRLTSVKAIRCDTPEGLQTLKYWLYDHLEGSAVGGVANFYAKYYGSITTVLPAGTPEAGKFVQTNWPTSPTHAWTVVGYNDSIRFDYNGDGQYTNNLDINSDGVVNMHDWEIGGLKFANGYAGTGWCNSGFCYMMYKTLADDMGFGGIWNHSVYIVDAKQTCSPQLTMKVTLKHDSRNKIKVTAGVSTDLGATVPAHTLEFPIFSFQGGNYYMQGGSNESDKTIEFGLDLDPLLSYLTPGQQAKFFLQVQEADPSNAFTGTIVSYSLIDYSLTTPTVINCTSGNVPIANNTTTRLSILHSPSFNKPAVTTATLPLGMVYQPYDVQLNASGGAAPYLWDVQLEYPESTSSTTFPSVTAQQLTLTNNNTGYAVKTLPFNFPFFKKSVNTLYIYADGYILFDDQPYTYPYLIDKMLLFRQTPIISPFMADLNLYPSQSDGIWYEGDASSATIRWKASINGMAGSSSVNIAVKLYPNGTIEFFYGNMSFPSGYAWTGGLSGGDNRNYQFTQYSGQAVPSSTLDKFTSCMYPVEMTVTEDGHFTGTPLYAYQALPVKFRVTDNNGISNTRVVNFTVNGLIMDYSINSGGDSLIESGENAGITLSVTNIGSQPCNSVNTWITGSDPYITITDSSQYLGTINPGQTLTFNNAFTFQVSPQVPDDHPFTLTFHMHSPQFTVSRDLDLMAYAPNLEVHSVSIVDGDNQELDPGETADLKVTFRNTGGAKINMLNIQLTPGDALLSLNSCSGSQPLLYPDSMVTVTCQATASPDAPFRHLYRINSTCSGANGYNINDTLWLYSGQVVDDFESGSFNTFNWQFINTPWITDTYQPWEGTYCTRSGVIGDNLNSALTLSANILEAGNISFMRRVSCEDDPNGVSYDYFAFLIDGVEMGRWDGILGWEQESYPVEPGYHTFRWIYQKDYSISAGSDCAWIDFVTLPAFSGGLPQIAVYPAEFDFGLDGGLTNTQDLYVKNTGGGELAYTVMVFDTSANKMKEVENTGDITLTCSAGVFVPGQDFSWNFTVTNNSPDDEYIREIRFDVPQGVVVTGAGNFSGGSLGDLVWDGTLGDGATITWHGEAGSGRGVIKPGESAVASLGGHIAESHTFDIFVVFDVRGDGTGASPHHDAGDIRITNTGLSNGWITVNQGSGNLLGNETDAVPVTFSSVGLMPGFYYASLLVRDPYNNIVTVPVTLNVMSMVGSSGPANARATRLIGNYPNPFAGTTTISYFLEAPCDVRIEVFDLSGRMVRTLENGIRPGGSGKVNWDGHDDSGGKVPAGVYYCRMTSGDYTGIHKLIITH